MAEIDVGATLHILTLVEMHARNARELLASGVMLFNTPDGLVMPGQPPQQYTNKQVGQAKLNQHGQAMRQLREMCDSAFSPTVDEPADPHPNRMRLHLNGDGQA